MNPPSDWQLTKHKLMQRGKHILETGKLSDCKFIVGQKPTQQIVKGHKIILAISSPVFEAMFFGEMAEKNEPIPIGDVQPEAFKALLEYIYMDIINPKTSELACELCYCAKKYMLPFLDEECTKFILSDLSPENACHVYEFASLLGKPLLINKCQEIFSTKTSSILKNPSFGEIQLVTLLAIFEQDKLQVNSEVELFSALEQWARSECMRKRLNPKEKKSLRSVIGNALAKIRFLTLTPQQFADGIAGSLLLQEDEALAIFMNISSKGKNLPMPRGLSSNTLSRVDPGQMDKMFGNTRKAGAVIAGSSGACTGQKLYCRRVDNSRYDNYSSSQSMNEHINLTDTNAVKDFVTFTVDRNVSIMGIKVPSQVSDSRRSGNLYPHPWSSVVQGRCHDSSIQHFSDIYDEMLTVTLFNSNETILASIDYTAQVKKDTLIEIMFNRLINVGKDEVYHISVIFNRKGLYPRISGTQKISTNSVSFSFGNRNSTDVVRSIIFSDNRSDELKSNTRR